MTGLFTLKEVVAALKRVFPSADELQMSRTLQHWTNLGVLTAETSSLHQGSGTHRRYALQQIYLAAILWELKWLQLPIRYLKFVAVTLLNQDRTHQLFEKAARDREQMLALWPHEEMGLGSHVIIPLHRVLSKVTLPSNT